MIDERRIEQLIADNATAIARLNSHLQATIPAYIEEYATSVQVAANGSTSLQIPASRDTYFKVIGIYVSVPLNTTVATLQLGSQFILPLQNTTTLLCPVQRILQSSDQRTLTFTCGNANGGQGFVWLFGEAIPKYGAL
jgi:hypothetical protein